MPRPYIFREAQQLGSGGSGRAGGPGRRVGLVGQVTRAASYRRWNSGEPRSNPVRTAGDIFVDAAAARVSGETSSASANATNRFGPSGLPRSTLAALRPVVARLCAKFSRLKSAPVFTHAS